MSFKHIMAGPASISYDDDSAETGSEEQVTRNIITTHTVKTPFFKLDTEVARLIDRATTDRVLIIHNGNPTERRELANILSRRIGDISMNGDRRGAKSAYFSFGNESNGDILHTTMTGIEATFDMIYCIIDFTPSKLLAERTASSWSLETEFNEDFINTFLEQPNLGKDTKYVDTSDWYNHAIVSRFRGNFRIGTEWDPMTFPINIVLAMICFTQHNMYEVHIMNENEKIKNLFETGYLFMCEGR